VGYFIMGRHTSRSWHATREEAERERERILRAGAWSHVPPRIEPDGSETPEGYEIETEAGEAPRYFVTLRGFQVGAPYDRSGAGSATFLTRREAAAFACAHARGERA
jgi:hypothetical protein